jgi:DNA primase small subunit
MPFCIHEATGKVCVPIPAEMLPTFDPETVPTLSTLQEEYEKGMYSIFLSLVLL